MPRRALFDANALDADGRNWTYLPVGPFPTAAAYDAWLRRMAAGDDPLFFTLVDRATGAPGGRRQLSAHRPRGRIDRGRPHQLLAAGAAHPRRHRGDVPDDARRLRARLSPLRMEVRRPERAVARAPPIGFGFTYEGLFRQADDLQGPQPRYGVVLDRRSRVPGHRTSVRSWLRPTNFDAAGSQRQRLADLIAAARGALIAAGGALVIKCLGGGRSAPRYAIGRCIGGSVVRWDAP